MEAGMEESKLARHYPFSKLSNPETICRNTMSGYSKTTGCVTDKGSRRVKREPESGALETEIGGN